MTTRREFLRSSAMLAAASAAGIAGAPQFSFGQTASGKIFIKVFMRGGADGLHLLPRYGDRLYYTYRPDLAIEPPSNDANSAIRLSGSNMRGLNPNLEPLMEIWEDGNLMFAPATALDEGNRSHFDCQRWIGTGDLNNVIDGYLNRYLQLHGASDHPLRGVTAGKTSVSREILGDIGVAAINRGEDFNLENNDFCSGAGCSDNQLTDLMRNVASHNVDLPVGEARARDTQLVMLDAIDDIQAAADGYQTTAGGLQYSGSGLGKGLKLLAQLIKAGIPLEVAAVDWNISWDTHANQVANNANPIADQSFGYNSRMRQGATDFVTFYRDMGAKMDDIVVLVCTEFGRTIKQNGSRGTDHGHSGAWFSFGGGSRTQIARDVNTLDIDRLGFGDKLPTVINYRDIVGEIMVRHLGMPQNLISQVFPGHSFRDERLFTASS